MTWLCNVQRSWGRWGFELVWLNQDRKDYLFDLGLFLRQVRIFLNINWFNSFHVQLVQLKIKMLHKFWLSLRPTWAICSSVKFSRAEDGIFSPIKWFCCLCSPLLAHSSPIGWAVWTPLLPSWLVNCIAYLAQASMKIWVWAVSAFLCLRNSSLNKTSGYSQPTIAWSSEMHVGRM